MTLVRTFTTGSPALATRALAACIGVALLATAWALPAGAEDVPPADAGQRTHLSIPHKAAPSPSDVLFVADVGGPFAGGDLDTECLYQSHGLMHIHLPVGRVIDDAQSLNSAGGLTTYAVLRVMAYDVDSASGPAPLENDKVFFRNVEIGSLEGRDGAWTENIFLIRADKLVQFPSDTGLPAHSVQNEITIDIDTLSGDQDHWCAAVDWVSLEIAAARPAMLVRGIFSTAGMWNAWVPWIDNVGLSAFPIEFPGTLDTIEDDAVRLATRATILQQRWGVQRINLVAHSKGGLDARAFAENTGGAARLAQIASPNVGSPVADLAQAAVLTGAYFTGGLTLLADMFLPGAVQLTTLYMGVYDLFHGAHPETRYCALAGHYEGSIFNGAPWWAVLLEALMPGNPSDLIVPIYSVHILPFMGHTTFTTGGGAGNGGDIRAIHMQQAGASAIFDTLSPFLFSPQGARECVGCDIPCGDDVVPTMLGLRAGAGLAPATTARSVSTVLGGVVGAVGEVSAGETRSLTIPVDNTGKGGFTLMYGDGDLDLVLISPSSQVIDPSVAASDPNIEFDSSSPETRLNTKGYYFDSLEAGTWTVEVTGVVAPVTPDTESFFIATALPDSTIAMTAATDRNSYVAGDTVVVTATPTDGLVAITGASASATAQRPDGTRTTFALLDDGVAPDAVNADGTYTGSFVTTDAGIYEIGAVADGATQPFRRQALVLAPASATTSSLAGTFSEATPDADGDSLFDSLTIGVDVDATADGTYLLLATLTDALGAEIATRTARVDLTAGSHSVPLDFGGETIFARGLDGPYRLAVVRLGEESTAGDPLPLGELAAAYDTAAYSHRAFEHPAVYVPGTGSDFGIDSDGDSRFNALQVAMDVDLLIAGSYRWSAKLLTSNGRDIGEASASAPLAAGPNTLTLTFDGSAIGEAAAAGPFRVATLLVAHDDSTESIMEAYRTSAYAADAFEPSARRAGCNKAGRSAISTYVKAALGALQKCIDGVQAGQGTPPCSSASSVIDLLNRAATKVAHSVAGKCPADLVDRMSLGGSCTSADDPATLATCLVSDVDAGVGVMIDAEYSDADATRQPDQARCQSAIGKAAARYALGRLKVLARCLGLRDQGRVAACPDVASQAKLAALASKLASSLAKGCTDPLVQALDASGGFGGSCAGATTAAALAACEAAEHDSAIDSLMSLLP